MWTRLQLKRPLILGALLLGGHSLLVTALWSVSLKNMEYGALWEHMRLTDLPVSFLLDNFYEAYSKVSGATGEDTYHTPYYVFHLVFGGIQFFIWGCLLGILWNRLLPLTPSRPAQKVSPS